MIVSKAVNLYDFDHTIYKGDASLDFIIYCMVRNPKLWKYSRIQGIAIIKYILGLSSRKQLKQSAFSFLKGIEDIDAVLDNFWSNHEKKITDWYSEKHRPSDILISASPEFLLLPITEKKNIGGLIATRMNKGTGAILNKNCRGEEKLRRLKISYPEVRVDYCYSDSLSDMPILTLAANPYIVKRKKIIKLQDYTTRSVSAFRTSTFLRFILVGILNALLGVTFSFFFSLFLHSGVLSFVLGYSLSIVISYLLNSLVTFQAKNISLKQFGSFLISYMPNFITQFITVFVLIGMFSVPNLLAYFGAVLVAVPVTFLLLTKYTYKGNAI